MRKFVFGLLPVLCVLASLALGGCSTLNGVAADVTAIANAATSAPPAPGAVPAPALPGAPTVSPLAAKVASALSDANAFLASPNGQATIGATCAFVANLSALTQVVITAGAGSAADLTNTQTATADLVKVIGCGSAPPTSIVQVGGNVAAAAAAQTGFLKDPNVQKAVEAAKAIVMPAPVPVPAAPSS